MRSKSLITILLVLALLGGFIYIILTNRPIDQLEDQADNQTQTEDVTSDASEDVSDTSDTSDTSDNSSADASDATSTDTSSADASDTAASTDTTATESASGGYTLADVASHASESDCWTAINGSVYDLTTWIGRHPGGPGPIKGLCGIDGTEGFSKMHGGSKSAEKALILLKIGDLQ